MPDTPTPEKMSFEYYAGAQRTPEWYQLRVGKVTASRLGDWLSVSKAKGKEGQPLEKRIGYERELQYERQFNVSYNNFVSDAMLDGIELEDFARRQYQLITGSVAEPCGAWYNDHFMASPDSIVHRTDSIGDGLLEIKIVRDNKFSEILEASAKKTHAVDSGEVDDKGKPIMVGTGVPEDHWKQIQGQLWASDMPWCDYVAVNLNTKKVKIIRVMPDKEFHAWLELAVPEEISVGEFSEENLYDIQGEIPVGINAEDNNLEGLVHPPEESKW